MNLDKEKLLLIKGGASTLNGTLINSIVRGITAFIDLGRSLGTAIRRLLNNNICPL